MKSLHILQGKFCRGEHWHLVIEELQIMAGQSWAFVGSNGSGKSTLARVLSGELPADKGQIKSDFTRPVQLSFERLSELVDEQWQKNNSDLFSEAENSQGLLTREVIQQELHNTARCEALADQFGIQALLDRPFSALSTGETRKALLCQTLMSQPDLLLLEEPFDGLDPGSRTTLQQHLSRLHQQGTTLVLIVNRFEDVPEFVQQVGILAEGRLQQTGPRQRIFSQTLITQLRHLENLQPLRLPDTSQSPDPLTAQTPLITLKNGRVSWGEHLIISGLNWQVKPGEHWQITGPNGAGKSTLLSLVTGDHPQGYSNVLTLFGRRRGSGETIWEIKQHIGYVSSQLHLEYRVSTTVRTVILSGFYDSVGLYQTPGESQLNLTRQWLTILGIDNMVADQPFRSLSRGKSG